jgi:hypothetical protein
MMFVDRKSGLSAKDRMAINTEVISDQMGMRMRNVEFFKNELGPNVKRDVPEQVMPVDLLGGEEALNRQLNMQEQQQQQMIPMTQQQMMPMVAPSSNPFIESQFNNSNMPDIPINTPPTVIGQLLSDEEVPVNFRDKYWYVFHKDNSLTFLDEDRKKSKLLNMDILKIDLLNTLDYYDYTFAQELEFDIARNVYETKLDRALGYGSKSGSPKNERILIQSQLSEQRHINDANSDSQVKQSFMRRLLGRR